VEQPGRLGYHRGMIVVLRAHGPRFFIFVDDHEPPHVHLRGDGQAKIVIVGRDGRPEIAWSAGMNHSEKTARHASDRRCTSGVA
jgi:hypothetical protein